LSAGHFGKELAADEETAQDEEEIDACPAPSPQCIVQTRRVPKEAIMIEKDDDDRQRPEVIQARESVCGWRGQVDGS